MAARYHLRTPAYEDVAEATGLLSGIGFECTGVAIAHGLQAGFHVLPGKALMHGAGVGYCMLVQLIVANEIKRFEQLFRFCKNIGLPVCTADIFYIIRFFKYKKIIPINKRFFLNFGIIQLFCACFCFKVTIANKNEFSVFDRKFPFYCCTCCCTYFRDFIRCGCKRVVPHLGVYF